MTARRKTPAAGRAARERGTGSITSYRTKAGIRWRFEIPAPIDPARPEEGSRDISRGGFTSYEEADADLTLLRADLIRKVPQAVGRDTFRAYGQRWLDGHACGNGTRTYIQRVRDAMDPYIGTVPLADVRATDLAAAYRGLEKGTKQAPSNKRPRRGLATSTVARYGNWVNTIFLAALDEGLIVKNPANSRHAGRPKGETAKRPLGGEGRRKPRHPGLHAPPVAPQALRPTPSAGTSATTRPPSALGSSNTWRCPRRVLQVGVRRSCTSRRPSASTQGTRPCPTFPSPRQAFRWLAVDDG